MADGYQKPANNLHLMPNQIEIPTGIEQYNVNVNDNDEFEKHLITNLLRGSLTPSLRRDRSAHGLAKEMAEPLKPYQFQSTHRNEERKKK